MKYCVRYKNTPAGRRCAQYSGYDDIGDWGDDGLGYYGDLAEVPVNVDAFLAPGIGAVTAIGTSTLLAYFGNAGSFATRHSGLIGAGAGAVSGALYGLARGMGAGLLAGMVGAVCGGAIELFQFVVTKRLQAAMTAPELPGGGGGGVRGVSGMRGMGYIRAKMLQGLGQQLRTGYKMKSGSALLDNLSPGVVF